MEQVPHNEGPSKFWGSSGKEFTKIMARQNQGYLTVWKNHELGVVNFAHLMANITNRIINKQSLSHSGQSTTQLSSFHICLQMVAIIKVGTKYYSLASQLCIMLSDPTCK